MIMRHLADTRQCPTIGVVLGVADRADGDAARVVLLDQLQAIGAAMFLFADQADRRVERGRGRSDRTAPARQADQRFSCQAGRSASWLTQTVLPPLMQLLVQARPTPVPIEAFGKRRDIPDRGGGGPGLSRRQSRRGGAVRLNRATCPGRAFGAGFLRAGRSAALAFGGSFLLTTGGFYPHFPGLQSDESQKAAEGKLPQPGQVQPGLVTIGQPGADITGVQQTQQEQAGEQSQQSRQQAQQGGPFAQQQAGRPDRRRRRPRRSKSISTRRAGWHGCTGRAAGRAQKRPASAIPPKGCARAGYE